MLQEIYESSNYLVNLKGSLLADSINIFLDNFFPPENRKNIIPNLISNIQSIEFGISKTSQPTTLSMAMEINKHLKNILEFIDKGNRGLLSGDLSQNLVITLRESLVNVIDSLKKDQNENKDELMNKTISLLYDKICNTAFGLHLFKLPVRGAPYAEYENPRNLFERQLLLEDESNDMAIEKFMSMYEDLQNFGLSYNLQFARKYIIEWFPNLTKAIKEEQELCITGDLKGDRKFYGPYLIKMSSEKLSLLALTELMKNILKLTQHRKDSELELDPHLAPNPYYIISKFLFSSHLLLSF